MQEGKDGLVRDLNGAAGLADAYRSLAGQFPDHAGGFLKLAAKHYRAATRACEELVARQVNRPPGSQP